jgi:hypothetical protein
MKILFIALLCALLFMSCESTSRYKTVKLIHNSQLVNVRCGFPYNVGDTLLIRSTNNSGWLLEQHAPLKDTTYVSRKWVSKDSLNVANITIRRAIVVN